MKHTLTKVLSLLMALTMIMGSVIITTSAVDSCAHEDSAVVRTVEATCTSYGYTVKKCNDCGTEFSTAVTDKVAHSYVTVPAKDPTCGEAGNLEYSACENCGKAEDEDFVYEIPATGKCIYEIYVDEPGHGTSWTKPSTDPNVYAQVGAGRIYEKCVMCGDENTLEVFGQDDHAFVYTITKAPTCVDNGFATYNCVECNQKWENVYVAPNTVYGHSFTKVVHLESECVAGEDYDVKVCAYCDQPEEAFPETTAHNWVQLANNDAWTYENGVEKSKVKTCTEDGYIVLICDNEDCGEHKIFTPESDYENQEWYELYGKHEGHKMTTTIQLGQNATDICQYYICTVQSCRERVVVQLDHDWAPKTDTTNWVQTQAPTCYNTGLATVQCLDCNASKEVIIPATGHKMDKYTCTTPNCAGMAANGACADCTHAGRKVLCSNANCDAADRNATDVATCAAHDGKNGETKVVAANCINGGFSRKVCANPGCTQWQKIEGSETPKNPNVHYNFTVIEGSYTRNTTDLRACEDAVLLWTCVCGVADKNTLNLYTNYDFFKANFDVQDENGVYYNRAHVIEVTGNQVYKDSTASKGIAAKDFFKAKGHLNYTKFTPGTDNKDNKLGLVSGDAFYGAASGFDYSAVTATCYAKGKTAGVKCVRCGEFTTPINDVAIDPNNHRTPTGSYVNGNETVDASITKHTVKLVSYIPATCLNAEQMTYDCICGVKGVEWKGQKDTSDAGHLFYTFNAGYDPANITNDTINGKIEVIKAQWITPDYSKRVFTEYKAPTCTTAGNHANLKCTLCDTVYYVSAYKNGVAANEKTTITGTEWCDIYGCSCKKAKDSTFERLGENDKTPVAIKALNHYNFVDKIYGETVKGTAPAGIANVANTIINGGTLSGTIVGTGAWYQIDARTETCVDKGYNAIKICNLCARNNTLVDSTDASKGTVGQKYFVDTVKLEEKAPHGNTTWQAVAAVEKTCLKDGKGAHNYCTVCKVAYPVGTTVRDIKEGRVTGVAQSTYTIPHTGHQYGEATLWSLTGTTAVNTGAYEGICTKGHFTAYRCTVPGCMELLTHYDVDGDKHVDLGRDRNSEYGWYIIDYVETAGHIFEETKLPTAEELPNFDITKAEVNADGKVVWDKTVTNGNTTTTTEVVTNVYYTAPDCEDAGIYYVNCTVCDAIRVIETVAATGHKDYDGNVLPHNCTSNGKECVNAGCDSCVVDANNRHIITGIECDLIYVVKQAATCTEDGIALYACKNCDNEYGVDRYTLLEKNNYDEETVLSATGHDIITYIAEGYVAPTYDAPGKYTILCANCGEAEIEIPVLINTDIYFDVTSYNEAIGEYDITNGVAVGSTIKVTLRFNTGLVYNALQLNIPFIGYELVDYNFVYDFDPLLAVKNEIQVNDYESAPAGMGLYNLKLLSYVTAAKDTNVAVEGEMAAFVELYFKANSQMAYIFTQDYDTFGYLWTSGTLTKYNPESSALDKLDTDDFEGLQTLDPANRLYIANTTRLFDVNNDGYVNEGDIVNLVSALVAAIEGEEVEYNNRADVNLDGKITVEDLQYIERYLLTEQTFVDYIDNYLFATSNGATTLDDVLANADISDYDFNEDGKEGTGEDRVLFVNTAKALLLDTDLYEEEYAEINIALILERIVQIVDEELNPSYTLI